MTTTPSAKSGSALEWIKSSHSTDDGPACLEVAATSDTVRVRDSKRVHGPHLAFEPTAWAEFLAHATGH
ncbi:DUF397 domain-containing protein [Streptomyces megasporus]|uniref:DUF397 domain-containing protein n=1 Tax=Streptomyces megasporus TaxID=44060 RepID=UPI0004E0E792|nr:DUF397 domain-containing protein [Streptomyces megasporus]